MIASPKDFAVGHKLRHVLAKRYAAKYNIDVFGGGYIPLENKVDGLAPYMFSVVIEISREEYYMSEKLMDAFLTRTVPIYWGAAAATRLFNPRGIITFSGEDDFEEALRHATQEYYKDHVDAIEKNHWQAQKIARADDTMFECVLGPVAREVARLKQSERLTRRGVLG